MSDEALTQLDALRFVVSTEALDNVAPSSVVPRGLRPLLVGLTWHALQREVAQQPVVNTTSRLWLEPTFEAWSAEGRPRRCRRAAARHRLHAVAAGAAGRRATARAVRRGAGL
jgi:hypothetical protein